MERFSNDEDVTEYFTRDILDKTREDMAKEKGLSEGEKIGITKGEKIGFAKGTKKTSMKIAKKMLARNKPIEEIADLVDLTIEEVKKLKAKTLVK